MKIERQCTVFRLITCKLTAMHRFFASERQCSVFRQISAENGCGMSKFYTVSSKFCFSRKNARILRKAVVDATDSLAEGVSCRQPTAVPLRQKIPPAKREQTKMHNFSPKIPPGEREQKQKRAGSQRNQLQFLLQVGTCGRILSKKFTNMFRRLIPVIQLIKQFNGKPLN